MKFQALVFAVLCGCVQGAHTREVAKGDDGVQPSTETPHARDLNTCLEKAKSVADYLCRVEAGEHEPGGEKRDWSPLVAEISTEKANTILVSTDTGENYPNFCDVSITMDDPFGFCPLTKIEMGFH